MKKIVQQYALLPDEDDFLEDLPFVNNREEISNLDPALADEMDGTEVVRKKDGGLTLRTKHRMSCIYCQSYECVRAGFIIGRGLEKPALLLCFCRGKKFRGKAFYRYAVTRCTVMTRWEFEAENQKKRHKCPACGSPRITRTVTGKIGGGFLLIVPFKCKRCGFQSIISSPMTSRDLPKTLK